MKPGKFCSEKVKQLDLTIFILTTIDVLVGDIYCSNKT